MSVYETSVTVNIRIVKGFMLDDTMSRIKEFFVKNDISCLIKRKQILLQFEKGKDVALKTDKVCSIYKFLERDTNVCKISVSFTGIQSPFTGSLKMDLRITVADAIVEGLRKVADDNGVVSIEALTKFVRAYRDRWVMDGTVTRELRRFNSLPSHHGYRIRYEVVKGGVYRLTEFKEITKEVK